MTRRIRTTWTDSARPVADLLPAGLHAQSATHWIELDGRDREPPIRTSPTARASARRTPKASRRAIRWVSEKSSTPAALQPAVI
jgi:hypothetical protein